MRIAIVHHWFVTRGGGERVAECLGSLFPEAEIFTLLATERGLPDGLRGRKIHTSFLQHVPFAASYHRHMMPLYAKATESLDVRGYDLVISSDSGPVKGVRVDPGAVHICYCHSPMRYLYDGYDAYRGQMGAVTRAIFTRAAIPLRQWDIDAAQRVTHFLANSRYVADRIRRCYGRESTVIYPPIDVDRGSTSAAGDHYLCAGRLVGYKRTELIVEACQRLGRRLRIAGTGPEEGTLRRLAGGDVTMLGEVSTDALWNEYAGCRALLFAADEDFGMVPLEAQACGRPVVAYGWGGSLETVRGTEPDRTGIFFAEQSVTSLVRGIEEFEAADAAGSFDAKVIREWADGFRTEVFLARVREFVLAAAPWSAEAMADLPLSQP